MLDRLMGGDTRWQFGSIVLAGFTMALGGCAIRIGPKTVARDRFDYAAAISRSWKEQMLLNMVKLRYMDPPMFIDVTQVVAQYTFEASGSINTVDWGGGEAGAAGSASGRWAESPTITYSPMTGETFIKNLMRPIAPVSLLSLIQAGWPIDNIFDVAVRAINGLHAGSRIALLRTAGNPDFYRVIALLRELQLTGAFGLRVEEKEGIEGGALFFRAKPIEDATEAKVKEVRRLLRLSPEVNEFKIAFGAVPKDGTELAFLTRSMLEILGETAMGVDIPASDLASGRASKVPTGIMPPGMAPDLMIQVRSSQEKPKAGEAFTAVHYRDHWFWVPDTDLSSKRGLTFLLTLFALAGSGTTAAPPVLTISRP